MPGTRPSDAARARFNEWMSTLADLTGAIRLLDWDRETTMPAGASEGRGRQVTTLSALHHRELVRDGIDDDIASIEAHGDPSDAERSAFRLARRARARALRTPESLVRAHADATSRGVTAWLESRATGNYATFAPELRRVVETTRHIGEAVEIGDEAYDGLLDRFEPGTRTSHIESLFAELAPALSDIIAKAPRPSSPVLAVADRSWPDDRQMAVARAIAALVGFDLTQGIIAVSAHPFTDSPHLGDVRFSTRFTSGDPTTNVMTVLHEAGHAMYSQGLPTEYDGSLLYATPSLGADESQSRFFENHLGRRRAFWERIHPMLVEHFGSQLKGIGPDDLYRLVSHVEPSWCRVDADEVTYDLHIVLRFGLEVALIRGDLDVDDLPEAWRARSEELLGVTPADDLEGCLQDIHWAWGLIGYFPTYTLGNIYAAQLTQALEREHGSLDELVASGRFDLILAFMRDRVHRHGCMYDTPELMQLATGAEFSTGPFLRRIASLSNG